MVVSFDDFNPLLTFIGGVIAIAAPFIGFIFYLVRTSKKAALQVEKRTIARIDKMEEESIKRIDKTKEESVRSIDENKQMIATVQRNLCELVQHNTEKITDRIAQQDKTMNKMDTVLEKIDEKLDAHADAVTRNTARLEGHDERIDNIERKIYKTPSKF